jgi:hypothetical protein
LEFLLHKITHVRYLLTTLSSLVAVVQVVEALAVAVVLEDYVQQ